MIDSINVRRYLKARAVRLELQRALQEAQIEETTAYGKLKGTQLTQAQQHSGANPYQVTVRTRFAARV